MPLAIKNMLLAQLMNEKKFCMNGEPSLADTYALALSAAHTSCVDAERHILIDLL